MSRQASELAGRKEVEELSLLYDHLESLNKKRSEVTRRINALQAKTRVLPNELLLKIFSFLGPTLDMGPSRNSRPVVRKANYDLKNHPTADLRRVAQVCSTWRGVSLGSPSLWSKAININEETYDWLLELLARCGDAPIHASIRCPLYRSPFRWDMSELTLQIIRPTQIASLIVISNSANVTAFSAIDGFISQCTNITHLAYNGPFLDRYQNHQLTLQHHLRQLEIHNCLPNLSDLSGLQHLSVSNIYGVTVEDWIRMLSNLPELVHLRMENAILSNGRTGRCDLRITFPRLMTLSLIGDFDSGIGDFLLAVNAELKYSLLLHCTVSKKSDTDLLLRGLEKWFEFWIVDLDPLVGARRIDFMASHCRFKLHNQIPGNQLSDEWFRIFLNWGAIVPFLLRKLHARIIHIFGLMQSGFLAPVSLDQDPPLRRSRSLLNVNNNGFHQCHVQRF